MTRPQTNAGPMALTSDGRDNLNFSVVVACNDDRVLHTSLSSSPGIASAREFVVKRGFPSAGLAYNAGLREATGEIVVFAHQDVYLPSGWLNSLARDVRILTRLDPNWGVLGVFGVTSAGVRVGHLYSTGLKGVVGQPFPRPTEVVSLDEVVLILRRNSGLKFDERLPGFHHYGTDICLEAKRNGMKAFAFDAFCVHNSNGIVRLPMAFWRSYFYMRKKWRTQLPVLTNILPITLVGWPVANYFLRTAWSSFRNIEKAGQRHADPAALFQTLPQTGQIKIVHPKEDQVVPES